ncbi:hypothetical protein E3N88_21018 [Mikania micrantha]|uniref:Uncharacterized protein n=1 Tax=Mikania micrantha TaxID=192012 RepID=A0A5N6NL69_9ASTR|nr:hypothetical protein E3N88_21018 [Mikania micrantha]
MLYAALVAMHILWKTLFKLTQVTLYKALSQSGNLASPYQGSLAFARKREDRINHVEINYGKPHLFKLRNFRFDKSKLARMKFILLKLSIVKAPPEKWQKHQGQEKSGVPIWILTIHVGPCQLQQGPGNLAQDVWLGPGGVKTIFSPINKRFTSTSKTHHLLAPKPMLSILSHSSSTQRTCFSRFSPPLAVLGRALSSLPALARILVLLPFWNNVHAFSVVIRH